MRYFPLEFNKLGIAHLVKHKIANLFAKPGAGKTAMTLTALVLQDQLEDDVFPALVVAPLRVAQSVWDEEIAKWDHTRHLRVTKILGNAAQRLRALKHPADVYVVNIENAAWLSKQFKDGHPFKTIIVDESSKLRGTRAHFRNVKGRLYFTPAGTVNASAVVRLGLSAIRRINLTGTPSANGLVSLWGQMMFLDHGSRLGHAFGAFQMRWFRQVRTSPIASKWVPYDTAFADIVEQIRNVTLSLDPKNYEDIKDLRVVDIPVKLSAAAREVYDIARKNAEVELKDKTLTLMSAGAVTAKLSQIANGYVYDEDSYHYLHEEKLPVLDDLLEELHGHNVIVTYHFKAELERLLKRYPHGVVLPKGAKQTAVMEAWNRGEIPLLFLHPASAGHGLSLQHGGCDIVILNPTYDLELYQQVIERIGPTRQMHSGYERTVSVYRIYAERTNELPTLHVLDGKATLQDAVMEAVRG